MMWLASQLALHNKSAFLGFSAQYYCPGQLLFRNSLLKFEMEKYSPLKLYLVPLLCARAAQDLVSRVDALSLIDEKEGTFWGCENGELIKALDCDGSHEEFVSAKKCKMERWRKIGLANKGRVPWNKGRKHSPETRARIKQKTIEALKDPKVRKKMSEHSRSHTEQSRSKLGLTLKKVWARRLKNKKVQQKCYLEWAQLISEAAKNGWYDQPQLEWDSYEKIEAEISRKHVFWLQIKAEERRIAKVRAEERARVKAEKMAVHARQKEREEKRKKAKREFRWEREQKIHSAKLRNLKLKAKLIKIHRKKQLDGQISFQEVFRSAHEDGIALEKWDLDYIMKEKEQQLPFEDLLRAAKNKCERNAMVDDVENMESILKDGFI